MAIRFMATPLLGVSRVGEPTLGLGEQYKPRASGVQAGIIAASMQSPRGEFFDFD
jgi:hypothetical protein